MKKRMSIVTTCFMLISSMNLLAIPVEDPQPVFTYDENNPKLSQGITQNTQATTQRVQI